MTIKAVLFDHDGTLVDSEQAHYEMWRDVLQKYDIELSHQEYTHEYAGTPTTTNAVTIVEKYSLGIKASELIRAKGEATTRYLSERAFPLMGGALESIRYFHEQGYKVGIVTGAGREGVAVTIKEYDISQYISVVVSGDDVIHSKPAPDCYLLAAQTLEVAPSECLALEDTYNGSMAAIDAGIKCVGISQSNRVRELFSGTVYECMDLTQATQWISESSLLQKSNSL